MNQRLTQDFKYNTPDLMACFALGCDSKMSCVLNDWDQKIKGTPEKAGSGPQMSVHCRATSWLAIVTVVASMFRTGSCNKDRWNNRHVQKKVLMPTFYSMHTHTHMHACMHTRTHSRMHAHIHTHMHAHMHTHTHAHTHACMHTHTHMHMHTHAHAHMQAWLYNILPWVTMATGSTVGGYAASWMISHSEWMGGLVESASLESESQDSESRGQGFDCLVVFSYP